MKYIYLATIFFTVQVAPQQVVLPVIRTQNNGTEETCPSNQIMDGLIEQSITNLLPILTMISTCGEGDWHQVASLNMSDLTQQCPSGWMEYSTIRSCGQPSNLRVTANCVSTFFSTSGRQYRKVCGRAIGYQWGTTDGFFRFVSQTTGTPDDNYLDGMSLTHGSSPRQHIWTFANGYYEATSNIPDSRNYVCPCAATGFGTTPPSYVGNNYFCETGNTQAIIATIHFQEPLWDGQGCVNSVCCTFNSPPWFSVTLPNPTTNDIEARLCADEGYPNEATTIGVLELYIQ